MHRTDGRSRWRFLLVQFPAFLVGLCLCISGGMLIQVRDPGLVAKDGLFSAGMSGFGDMVVLMTIGMFCLVLGLELWRLDRPRK
jgi:hypothetical protein